MRKARHYFTTRLKPSLISITLHPQPSISPTKMPLTKEPSASPFTSVPSVEFSITPILLYIEPSVSPTPHPVAPTSQVPSVMSSEIITNESPTGSPNNPTVSPNSPTASPNDPTASPHDPTASPFYPSDSPTDQPTMRPETEAPIATQVAMNAFSVCPSVQSSMASRNDLVSYQVGSTWKVYQCVEDHCSAGSSKPGSSWILVGTCRNKPAERDGSNPTSEVSLLFCLQGVSFGYSLVTHFNTQCTMNSLRMTGIYSRTFSCTRG